MLSISQVYGIVSIINGFATFLVAIFVLAKARSKLFGIIWAVTLIFATGWCVCTGIGYLQNSGEKYLFWIQYNNRFAIFIPTFFFHFVILFCKYKVNRKIIISNYVAGFLILLLSFIVPEQWLPGFKEGKQFLFIPTFPGYLYIVYTLFFGAVTSCSYFLLIKSFLKALGLFREQLKFLLIGSLFGFIAGGSTFPNGYGFEIPWGNYSFILMPLSISYAIINKRLFDIKIAFTRAGIFLVVYSFVLGIPFLILYRTGSGILATSLAVIVATMGPIIYRFLQLKAEAVILAEQKKYQKVLLRAAIGMVTEHDLKKLAGLIVFILKRTIRIDFAAIYIVNSKEKTCNLEVMRGRDDSVAILQSSLHENHPFIAFLKTSRDPFLMDEVPEKVKDSFGMLHDVKAVIPSFSGDKLLGFVLLGQKMNNHPYSEDDLSVFKILSRQAALAIENCFFFEETKSSQERMFAAEKLASIGGMADGLAHQIKNRLNQFSLAAGELKAEIEDFTHKNKERLDSDPEGLGKTFGYLHEIAISLLDNVKRTDGVIKGILDFQKTEKKDNLYSNFLITEITELSLNLLKVKHEVSSIPLSVKYDNDGLLYANKAQMTEVIYNLLDNAYEATKERQLLLKDTQAGSFSPLIELSLTFAHNRQIIRIRDNGIGVKNEDKDKMFAPFFTTKTSYKSGSGIGIYVVKRIVEENHKGRIWFESEYAKGTTFIIELPLKIQ